jgi:ketosteroid isomerase-like protein
MPGASASSEIDPVLQANRKFYRALTEMDMQAMGEVWLHEDWVRCVHPGWAPIEGWPALQESWQRIFENTEHMHVTVGGVFVSIQGEMAWVSCVERVSTTAEGRMDMAYVQATNLFVLRAGVWRMVLHHASHLPIDAGEGEETVH